MEAPLSAVKQALLVITDLRAKLEALTRSRSEPIAIIGMGCQFPGGATSPEAFFDLLEARLDAVSAVPESRFTLPEGAPRATRWGAFLAEVDRFDAAFFGVSPREAESMDPQQRLLLEVAWEALERAGQVPSKLSATPVGVFVGMMNDDYRLLAAELAPERRDAHTATGTHSSFAAGRLSYALGFTGPSLVVDTACSSSLVALHLACQSLRSGEVSLALAAGVNLILGPFATDLGARLGALSPEGRCRTFDARADGYVRGEGVGVVVLKRLSDAMADGDPVVALIRGSAVNQDGRSAGLTSPNARAQRALLEKALADAGVSASQVGFVETHGTGTALGDPIEVEALSAVFGGERPRRAPCWLGALKTNVGHLEGAAGIAGVIKAVLCLERERIPPNLHLETPNPRIQLAQGVLAFATQGIDWPRDALPRLAGVSAFGLSGTNAHIILEEAPRTLPAAAGERRVLVPISARSKAALADSAVRWTGTLERSPLRLDDVAFTAATRREHHAHRAVITGRSMGEIVAGLRAVGSGSEHLSVERRLLSEGPLPRLNYVYSGHGPQHVGMGHDLYASEPVFAAALDEVDRVVYALSGIRLIDAINAEPARSRLDDVTVAQPALFGVAVALTALLRSWGLVPSAVVGHSLGEVAAAYVAGALSLEDAVRVVSARSRMLRRVAGRGAMAIVDLGADHTGALVQPWQRYVVVAGRNGPTTTLLSGPPEALHEALACLQAEGASYKMLSSDIAFHGPEMASLASELEAELTGIVSRPLTTPWVSTVTGNVVARSEAGAGYWAENLRRSVQFQPAIAVLAARGPALFVEVGPRPQLRSAIEDTLRVSRGRGRVLATLRGRAEQGAEDEREALLAVAAAAHVEGLDVDFSRIGPRGRAVPLPTYPFAGGRHWIGVPSREAPASKLVSAVAPTPEALGEVRWISLSMLATPEANSLRWLVIGPLEVTFEAKVDRLADSLSPMALERAVFEALSSRPTAVVFTAFGQPSLDSSAVVDASARLAAVIRAVASRSDGHPPRLVLVTRGACAVRGGESTDLLGATLWGLARVVATEHPELAPLAVDLDSAKAGDAGALLREVSFGLEAQVALRDGNRFAPRFIRREASAPWGASDVHGPRFDPERSYLLTGGAGALGGLLAGWMIERGARHIALLGRREPGRESHRVVSSIEAAGGHALILRGDVSVTEDVRRAFDEIDRQLPPLDGVIHAAGIAEPQLLRDLDRTSLDAIFAPKVHGSWNLHLATRGRVLSSFVLVSSSASWLGLPGQGSYAAANAFLDALAIHRRHLGLPACSIGLSAVEGLGMLDSAEARRFTNSMICSGIGLTSPKEALRAFDRIVSVSAPAHVLVLPRDDGSMRDASPRLRALLGEEVSAIPSLASSERQRLAAISPRGLRVAALTKLVAEELGSVLRLPVGDVSLDEPMISLGLDSILAVELRGRLEARLGLSLPVTLAWQHPTLASLGAHLADLLAPVVATELPGVSEPVSELPDMLTAIEALSDDEVQLLLTEG